MSDRDTRPATTDDQDLPRLGEQELALLQHLDRSGPATVAEVAESFGAARGLARTTVLTMMERLRGKGQLERRRAEGVWRYRTRVPATTRLRSVVRRFVDGALGGSVQPFVAYLAEREEVSAGELAELEALVERLKTRQPADGAGGGDGDPQAAARRDRGGRDRDGGAR